MAILNVALGWTARARIATVALSLVARARATDRTVALGLAARAKIDTTVASGLG